GLYAVRGHRAARTREADAPARRARVREREGQRPTPRQIPAPAHRMSDIRDGLVGAIGNTPLIRLRGPSELTGCEILGKAEFLNPGGSVKDRAGLFLILDAEQRGVLKPGGLIVEGTARSEERRVGKEG